MLFFAMFQTVTASLGPCWPTSSLAIVRRIFDDGDFAAEIDSRCGGYGTRGGACPITAELPLGRAEVGKPGSWVPAKEMALVFEIFDRAGSDPESEEAGFAAPLGFAETAARILDHHPLQENQGLSAAAPRTSRGSERSETVRGAAL